MSDRKQKANAAHGGFIDPEVATDNHDKVMLWLDSNAESIVSSFLNDKEGTYKISKQWERPITKGDRQYKTIVGYLDMLCIIEKMDGIENGREYFSRFGVVAFEVKSKITSIGEVIRQINQYRTFCHVNKFYIVSPDDRFSEILKQQGIGFIKTPSIEELS